MEYRELAEKSGIKHWRRVPALNTDERFIADMADMVVSPSLHSAQLCGAARNPLKTGTHHCISIHVASMRHLNRH